VLHMHAMRQIQFLDDLIGSARGLCGGTHI
jgi:hypothetical protein